MNDFTKEELEELLNGYEHHSHNTRHNWPSLDLCKKIQSMIDNYCEHDFVTFLQDQNKEPFIEKCLECHELRVFNE